MISPATSPVKIDGVLDEAAWGGASAIPIDLEWFPGDNISASVVTACLVTYDPDNLYIGFRASDPDVTRIRAHYADRDAAFLDDTVGFMIDPFNDERRAFQFRVNALGVQMDGVNSDVDSSEDWSWDALWASAGRIGPDGYTVEVAIPFSSLRFPKASTDATETWGFMAFRDWPRSTRVRMRSSWTDRDRSCVVCQLDKLTGFKAITPGRNLEFDPTVTAARTDERAFRYDPATAGYRPAGPLTTGPVNGDLGLTVRWGITPNLTTNLALNPDFSQVEADSAQLDVNHRFALFYPEKRPFFLEGADLFATPIEAVFTRTVDDPLAGLKLSGKNGRDAYGVFVARDRKNDLLFPSNQSTGATQLEDDVTSEVVRYRRDIAGASNLGVLYTGRESGDYSNQVAGFDGTIRPGDSDSIRFQYLASRTRYPLAVALANGQKTRPFGGGAFDLNYQHETRSWSVGAGVGSLSPDFRADSGFVPRVDTRSVRIEGGRTFWGKPGGWFNRIDLSASFDRTERHDGRRTDLGQDFFVNYSGPLQSSVEFGYSPNREYFDGVTYNDPRQFIGFELRPTGDFSIAAYARGGKTIDFENSRQARFVTVNPGIGFNVGRRIEGTLDHTYEHLNVAGGELYRVNLTQTRLLYHLGLRSFFRAIVQYQDLTQHPDRYLFFRPDPRTRSLFTQFLYSYKLNPQSLVLVGYSNRELAVRSEAGPSYPLTRTDRTLFVKFGYAWVL